MCGRTVIRDLDRQPLYRDYISTVAVPRGGEMGPGSIVTVLTQGARQPFWANMVWGFPTDDRPLFNARSETVLDKPTFAPAMAAQRILMPVEAFFEWRKDPSGTKTKFRFSLPNQRIFLIAGLYRRFGAQDYFTVLTKAADAQMQPYHHRQPVVVPDHLVHSWLTVTTALRELLAAVVSYQAQYHIV